MKQRLTCPALPRKRFERHVEILMKRGHTEPIKGSHPSLFAYPTVAVGGRDRAWRETNDGDDPVTPALRWRDWPLSAQVAKLLPKPFPKPFPRET